MMVLRGLRCCGGIMGVWQAPEEWITDWTQALQRLIDRIGPCFQRPEPRRRVGRLSPALATCSTISSASSTADPARSAAKRETIHPRAEAHQHGKSIFADRLTPLRTAHNVQSHRS